MRSPWLPLYILSCCFIISDRNAGYTEDIRDLIAVTWSAAFWSMEGLICDHPLYIRNQDKAWCIHSMRFLSGFRRQFHSITNLNLFHKQSIPYVKVDICITDAAHFLQKYNSSGFNRRVCVLRRVRYLCMHMYVECMYITNRSLKFWIHFIKLSLLPSVCSY